MHRRPSRRPGRPERAPLARPLTLALGLVLAVAAGAPAGAAVSIYAPPEDLAARAALVVEGTVSASRSGYDPQTGRLATYVTLDVSAVLRGPAGLERVVIREPGGRYGDLGHAVDAVPVYVPGERVLAFLEVAPDGALRTCGLLFGKFTLVSTPDGPERARRDLARAGLIGERRPASDIEEFSAGELRALAAGVAPVAATAPAFSAVPPEFGRLLWDGAHGGAGGAGSDLSTGTTGGGSKPGGTVGGSDPGLDFVPMSATDPVRWHEADSGTPVSVNVDRARDPLGNPQLAVDQMVRAMDAWTNVPEARLQLVAGNTSVNYLATGNGSPASSFPPYNIILFGDPYNDITDPSGCSGTLAIGGYWYSTASRKTINNRAFWGARRLYVIFNNNFGCFLGNPDNLAEVAAHELGHGIGYGHSTVFDAIMRASAYGNRGPRLGDDDRDGAHCHYPHTLTVTAPNGGEDWPAGTQQTITWTATAEAGPDPGVVDIEYSVDDGATWQPVATGETNDGAYPWTVPDTPSTLARVRVIRPNLVSPTPSPYPSACSSDAGDAPFTISPSTPPVAGTVPDGASATAPLTLAPATGGQITLSWGASCSGEHDDHAIYEGSLASLAGGTYDHQPVTCSAGPDLSETITPAPGARYYLVAPLAAGREGLLGTDGAGTDRPASGAACAPRETGSCR
ncbi:MAG: hypothetical protein Kow0062_28720 [Acidobacteriota bacterium]